MNILIRKAKRVNLITLASTLMTKAKGVNLATLTSTLISVNLINLTSILMATIIKQTLINPFSILTIIIVMRQIKLKIIATIVTTFVIVAVGKINTTLISHSTAKRTGRRYMKIKNLE